MKRRKIVDYILIYDCNGNEIQEKILKYLQRGYELYLNIVVSECLWGVSYAQAMVKYEDVEEYSWAEITVEEIKLYCQNNIEFSSSLRKNYEDKRDIEMKCHYDGNIEAFSQIIEIIKRNKAKNEP